MPRPEPDPELRSLQVNLRTIFFWLTALALLFAVMRYLPFPGPPLENIEWSNLPISLLGCLGILGLLFVVVRYGQFSDALMAGWVGT